MKLCSLPPSFMPLSIHAIMPHLPRLPICSVISIQSARPPNQQQTSCCPNYLCVTLKVARSKTHSATTDSVHLIFSPEHQTLTPITLSALPALPQLKDALRIRRRTRYRVRQTTEIFFCFEPDTIVSSTLYVSQYRHIYIKLSYSPLYRIWAGRIPSITSRLAFKNEGKYDSPTLSWWCAVLM